MSDMRDVDVFDLAACSQIPSHERSIPFWQYDDPEEEAAFLAWYKERSASSEFSEIRSSITLIMNDAPDWQLGDTRVIQACTFTRLRFVREVFNSCWEAHNFQQHGDQLKCEHQNYAAANETRGAVAELASKLSNRLQAITKDSDHPLSLHLWVASQSLESNKRITIEGAADWAEAIAALAEVMQNVPIKHYRTHRACLEYPEPIESGRDVGVATALAFDLNFTCREYTENGITLRRRGPMPTYGHPCWAVVAGLINLTLDSVMTAENARDTVRHLIANSAPYRSDWPRSFPGS